MLYGVKHTLDIRERFLFLFYFIFLSWGGGRGFGESVRSRLLDMRWLYMVIAIHPFHI